MSNTNDLLMATVAFAIGFIVGHVVQGVLLRRIRDPVVSIRLWTVDVVPLVLAGVGRRRRRSRSLIMWVPVDRIDVGDVCALKVIGTKKSGALVAIPTDQYNASDDEFASVVGDQVTGEAEGVAVITASLVANPAISGQCVLAVADPIMTLEVSVGREVDDPQPA